MGKIRNGGQQQNRAFPETVGDVCISAEDVVTLVHDLKNLLLPIQISAGLLREQNRTQKQEKCLRTILEQTDRIKQLIDDVVLSRDGLLWSTAIDISELISQVARRVSADLRVGITCSYPQIGPIMVRGTEVRLWRVLHNLVLNAAEAVGEGGKVQIRLSLDQTGGRALIEVEDSGPGIAAPYQTSLFTAFTTTKPGGNGLGLVVVRKLLQQLGGEVSFRSESGQGTIFLVSLPLASASSRNEPAGASGKEQSHS
ncbi:MAG: ATP-binding protein [Acidobacteriota bacterium]